MSEAALTTTCKWLCTGDEFFPAMLAAIEAAGKSICLEVYTFFAGSPGERFRAALVRARQRGVRVQVLVDAVGSFALPGNFWDPLHSAGGEVRVFNPITLNRFGLRNHRKLLACDERAAFIGGFNIAPEYEGDGVGHGWCEIAVKLEGPLVAALAASFQEMFSRADFLHKRFVRLRRLHAKTFVSGSTEQVLISGPGRGQSPIRHALHQDLTNAREVKIMVAYFLPTRRLKRDLTRVVSRGGRVQLILAGKSDVLVSQLAGRSLYRRLLKSGVEIFEYQPQILHAKLVVLDDKVYVGSSNLDQRSLQINYELMVRLHNRGLADEANAIFSDRLRHCRQITRDEWRNSQTLWRKFKQRWAYFFLVRIDPYIARRQWRALTD